MQSLAEMCAPGFVRCSSEIMSEGEGDEVNCCPIAARTDSTHRPHLATTGISGHKKCFTGLVVMLRRGVEIMRRRRVLLRAHVPSGKIPPLSAATSFRHASVGRAPRL